MRMSVRLCIITQRSVPLNVLKRMHGSRKAWKIEKGLKDRGGLRRSRGDGKTEERLGDWGDFGILRRV